MGFCCSSGIDISQLEKPSDVANAKNERLKEIKFHSMGWIYEMKDYQRLLETWQGVRSDGIMELSELSLRSSFEVIRKEAQDGLTQASNRGGTDDKPLRSSYMGAQMQDQLSAARQSMMSNNSFRSNNQLDAEDKQNCMVFRQGETIRLGLELYEAMFYKPELTQLRVQFAFERTDAGVLNISTEQSDKVLYSNYTVSSARPLDIGFSSKELNLLGTQTVQFNQGQDGQDDATGNRLPPLSYLTFEHVGGSPLLIKKIRVSLSQSCEPFTGIFAKLEYSSTDPNLKNFLSDVKEGMHEHKIQNFNPDLAEDEEPTYRSDKHTCHFFNSQVVGNKRSDEDEKALVVSNDGRPIKIRIAFHVPTSILNLRVQGKYQIKLRVHHYGPDTSPGARFFLNGKHDQLVHEVSEEADAEDKPLTIILDLNAQDVRKYNLLEIKVSNQPEWYALKCLEMEMCEVFMTVERINMLKDKQNARLKNKKAADEAEAMADGGHEPNGDRGS